MITQCYSNAVIPVVAIDAVEHALPLKKALLQGGINMAEITFRTAAASKVIAALCDQGEDFLVGAGTILCVAQAKQAVEAGAKFLVTPGLDQRVVDWALSHDVPIIPGVVTPSEIMHALQLQCKVLKFFPSEASGGTAMLQALAGPYGDISFLPTGGIGVHNIGAYLELPQVLACGSSWICPRALIAAQQFDEITARTQKILCAAHGFTLLHPLTDGAAAQISVGVRNLRRANAFLASHTDQVAAEIDVDGVHIRLDPHGSNICLREYHA